MRNMLSLSIDNAADLSSLKVGLAGFLNQFHNKIRIRTCQNHNLALPLVHMLKKVKKPRNTASLEEEKTEGIKAERMINILKKSSYKMKSTLQKM